MDFTIEEFHLYKGNWLLYRGMGHTDENGAFISPLTYFEAQQMPKREIEIFMRLDDLASKTIRSQTRKKGL